MPEWLLNSCRYRPVKHKESTAPRWKAADLEEYSKRGNPSFCMTPTSRVSASLRAPIGLFFLKDKEMQTSRVVHILRSSKCGESSNPTRLAPSPLRWFMETSR